MWAWNRHGDDAKLDEAESVEFGRGWPHLVGSLPKNDEWSWEGAASYMATFATCSSSLAMRRSWRMTRSLSDLNSRSTSSSLSSIFWSKNTEWVSSMKPFKNVVYHFKHLNNFLETVIFLFISWLRDPAAVNIFLCCHTQLWLQHPSMCWSIILVNCSNHNNNYWDRRIEKSAKRGSSNETTLHNTDSAFQSRHSLLRIVEKRASGQSGHFPLLWPACSPEHSSWPLSGPGSLWRRSHLSVRSGWAHRSCPQTTPPPPGRDQGRPCLGTGRPGTDPTGQVQMIQGEKKKKNKCWGVKVRGPGL